MNMFTWNTLHNVMVSTKVAHLNLRTTFQCEQINIMQLCMFYSVSSSFTSQCSRIYFILWPMLIKRVPSIV